MKVAIVYDRVNKWGGAERVLLALHEMFPEAPLYTSVYSVEKANWAQIFPKIVTCVLNRIPYIRTKHELLGTLMPIVFESFDFSGEDLVISVTSEAAKGVITKGKTKHISYCLTPTRYLWSHYDLYFKNRVFKALTKPVVSYLRKWDRVAAQRPDVMIAISSEVQGRIKKYYNRDAIIIYPPHGLGDFRTRIKGTKGYFLIVSRLVPYKKVDLAIEAFNEFGDNGIPKKLLIIGKGSQESRLKKLVKENVEFVGELTDEKLASYYRNARALLMPQLEDFGLVSIEAQSFGTPVIAYNRGGAKDTVIDGITGILFDKQNKESLTRAIKRFEETKFEKRKIIENAKKFSKENFKNRFFKLVKNI